MILFFTKEKPLSSADSLPARRKVGVLLLCGSMSAVPWLHGKLFVGVVTVPKVCAGENT